MVFAMRANRSGFSLIEVIVASLIVVVLAAIVLPNVVDYMNNKRAVDTAQLLVDLGSAVTDPSNGDGFYQLVQRGGGVDTYPGQLSELVNPITTTTADRNSCGGTFNTTAVASWTANGPFLGTMIATTGGLMSPIGLIQDSISRNPPATNTTTTAAGVLEIRMLAVDLSDAQYVDRVIDRGDGPTKGQLRYTDLGTGFADVKFLVPAGARC
jgi:prepilin-type N-terminal cleavage/methylation domain-containing protein